MATRLAQSHGLVYVLKLVQEEILRLSKRSHILLVRSQCPCKNFLKFLVYKRFTSIFSVSPLPNTAIQKILKVNQDRQN